MDPVPPSQIRLTSERYLELVDHGVLGPDDRVELLEGVVVAMAPQNPRHASGVARVQEALYRALRTRTDVVIRVQLAFRAGAFSVPEPDVAIVPGTLADYDLRHPDTALLVVEVADRSLVADRLSKSRIYAAAGIPELWIVNLRADVVEVFRAPDRQAKVYAENRTYGAGDEIVSTAVSGAELRVRVADLIPARA